MRKTTIDRDTDALSGAIFAIIGGKFRLQETEWPFSFRVLDDAGDVIGSASDRGNGFAVHTRPYGGHVDYSQVIYVSMVASSACQDWEWFNASNY